MARIAIIGGGFAGTFAARHLSRKGQEVVLFEPRNRFVFTPLLHEVAGGVLDERATTISYAELFSVQHVRTKVKRIDLAKKTVHADKAYRFDYILIAPGAESKRSGTLRSYDDAVRIRATIEQNVKKGIFSCTVIGGGPTGVEVAGEVHDLIAYRIRQEGLRGKPDVTLLQSRDELLPQFPPEMGRIARSKLTEKGIAVITGARVEREEKRSRKTILHLTVGRKRRALESPCTIWTIGITPANIPGLKTPIAIMKTLQLPGHYYAFAAGDASAMDPPLPQLAQVASKQGTHAAKSILRLIKGKRPQEFRFKDRGRLVSVGQKWAVGTVMGRTISGFPAWFIMRTVYLFKFRSIKQELRTAVVYTLRLFKRDSKCAERLR